MLPQLDREFNRVLKFYIIIYIYAIIYKYIHFYPSKINNLGINLKDNAKIVEYKVSYIGAMAKWLGH